MSTGVGMGECCLSGTLHSGKPTGREIEIGGRDVYVTEPEGGSKAKTLIFLSDIFGWKLNNTRLLADNYAKSGFYVYVPDLHEGDSLPAEFLDDIEPPLKVRENLTTVDKATKTAKVGATLGPWLAKHREGVSKPIVDGFINEVKKIPGTDKVGAIGFCWGGRYAILAAHGQVDAVVACHPSLVSVPADFNDISKPILILTGDEDSLVPMSEVEKIKGVLHEKKDIPSEVKVYEKQVHGFTLRGDWSNDKDKIAMDDAEVKGKGFFHRYLS